MKKKKATPKSSPKTQRNNNSVSEQHKAILHGLGDAKGNGLSTIELREEFDRLAPAPRIWELRHEFGYNIQLVWDRDRTAQGHLHNCGRYILFPGTWGEVAA